MEEAPPNLRQQQSGRNRQILFVIIIYLLLTMSQHIGRDSTSTYNNALSTTINQNPQNPQIVTIAVIKELCKYSLEGYWQQTQSEKSNYLSQGSGKSLLKVQKESKNGEDEYILSISLYNGKYVDKGQSYLKIYFKPKQWIFENSPTHQNFNRFVIAKLNESISMRHASQKLWSRQNYNPSVNITAMELNIKTNANNQPIIYFFLKTDSPIPNDNPSSPNPNPGYSINIFIKGYDSRVVDSITFSFILIIISFFEFSAIISILRGVMDGSEQPQNFSLITMLIAMMWDCVLCLIAFTKAFETDENLVLFIMPGFVFCLLFTNLQLRLMISIFKAHFGDQDIRQLLCRFNIMSYGCLLAIWPIMRITNMNQYFFIGISLIFVPQILVNGIRGQRPQVNSPYYMKFLLIRFLSVFYVRGYPWNIFDMEPDYLVCGVCLIFLVIQLSILQVQKTWGPKTVIPAFLLPPIFNYGCDNQFKLQQASQGQCIICLAPLHQQVLNDTGQQIKHRIMKTPCNHFYHGSCLVKWMKIKMECPACRFKLPPYQ